MWEPCDLPHPVDRRLVLQGDLAASFHLDLLRCLLILEHIRERGVEVSEDGVRIDAGDRHEKLEVERVRC